MVERTILLSVDFRKRHTPPRALERQPLSLGIQVSRRIGFRVNQLNPEPFRGNKIARDLPHGC